MYSVISCSASFTGVGFVRGVLMLEVDCRIDEFKSWTSRNGIKKTVAAEKCLGT